MQTSPNATQLQKAHSDLNAVMAGTKARTTIRVTPATRPVLEMFWGKVYAKLSRGKELQHQVATAKLKGRSK